MKVLLINKFLYPKGGDAISTLSTGDLLTKKGHECIYWGMDAPENPQFPYKDYFVSHVDYNRPSSIIHQFKLSLNILYSLEARNKMNHLVGRFKPDIVHLNNFAHQISPSILDVIKRYDIPVVMTMRDYKMVCPSYTMMAKGKTCERCKGGRFYFCLLKKCTRNSAMKSMVNTAEMYLHHRILHIYDKIDIYISPSKFLKNKVEEMGLRGRVVYLPNFVHAEKMMPSYGWEEKSIVYVGRLSYEKGLDTFMDAVKGLPVRVKMIGEGPLREELISKLRDEGIGNVEFLGYREGENLFQEIRKSMFAVIPSEWYENNPRSIIEAFALGKPAVGSRIGGIPELVKDGETGFTFEQGNAVDLREKILSLLENEDKIVKMGRRARALVEDDLHPERHYQRLMEIYTEAMKKCSKLLV